MCGIHQELRFYLRCDKIHFNTDQKTKFLRRVTQKGEQERRNQRSHTHHVCPTKCLREMFGLTSTIHILFMLRHLKKDKGCTLSLQMQSQAYNSNKSDVGLLYLSIAHDISVRYILSFFQLILRYRVHFDEGYFTHTKILDPFVCESSAKNKNKKKINWSTFVTQDGPSFHSSVTSFIYSFTRGSISPRCSSC